MTTIRELRERKRWSQQRLAIESGLAIATISRIENGRPLMPSTKRVLADALGVRPEDITEEVVNRVGRRPA